MKPLHFLAFTMIAGIFLSACSSNILSGRHYNLNLVKVEKTQQKTINKNKLTEPEVPENITASGELVYVNTQSKKVWSKPATEKNNDLHLNKNANHSEPKPKAFVQNKNQQTQLEKSKLTSTNQEVKIDPLAAVSFLFGFISIASIFGTNAFKETGVLAAFAMGILAFITGSIALNRINNGKSKGYGFAIIGLTIGLIFVVILALILSLAYLL